MHLYDFAHARTGDKGNTSTLSVIAYQASDFMWLKRFLTAERVQQFLGEKVKGSVIRYELPQLHALHFVLEGALGGGVTRSLAVDAHGKSLSYALLAMPIPEQVLKSEKAHCAEKHG